MSSRMTLLVDLDYVTVACPCGASQTGVGEPIARFIHNHREHTDGTIAESYSARGNSVWASPQPLRVIPIETGPANSPAPRT